MTYEASCIQLSFVGWASLTTCLSSNVPVPFAGSRSRQCRRHLLVRSQRTHRTWKPLVSSARQLSADLEAARQLQIPWRGRWRRWRRRDWEGSLGFGGSSGTSSAARSCLGPSSAARSCARGLQGPSVNWVSVATSSSSFCSSLRLQVALQARQQEWQEWRRTGRNGKKCKHVI